MCKYMIVGLMCLLVAALTGCGAADRFGAAMTGGPSKTCYEGVLYLQFTSGATAAYNRDGTIKTCGN